MLLVCQREGKGVHVNHASLLTGTHKSSYNLYYCKWCTCTVHAFIFIYIYISTCIILCLQVCFVCVCFRQFCGTCICQRTMYCTCLPLSCVVPLTVPPLQKKQQCKYHTLSIAFRHLPPNSARFGYATEGALYLHAAVHRRGQRLPKGLGTNKTVEAT